MVRVTADVATARTSDAGSDERRRGHGRGVMKSAIETDVSPAHPSVRRIGPRDASGVFAKCFGDFMESIETHIYRWHDLPLA